MLIFALAEILQMYGLIILNLLPTLKDKLGKNFRQATMLRK